MAVKEAIETGVVHLIVQGVQDKLWSLKDPGAIKSPVIQAYLKEHEELTAEAAAAATRMTAN